MHDHEDFYSPMGYLLFSAQNAGKLFSKSLQDKMRLKLQIISAYIRSLTPKLRQHETRCIRIEIKSCLPGKFGLCDVAAVYSLHKHCFFLTITYILSTHHRNNTSRSTP